MRQLTFLELARRVIEEEKRPLSVEEIWDVAQARGYDREIGSTGKTPQASIGSRIYVDIRDNPNSPFVRVDSRPRRFSLRGSSASGGEHSLIESDRPKLQVQRRFDYLERDLHPLLAYFASFHLKAYTKTIAHNKSEKKEFGEWIHPDMVDCYFPIEEWKPEVVELNSLIGSVAIKLFSFEIKRELSFANLRESFFQAVSNSSWANEAYLVASRVSNDEEFLNELRRLSASFGIGIISLDVTEPDSTEILFPANNREFLDWDMVNKLSAMNTDFREFLKRIKIDISSKEIRKERYDEVMQREKLIQKFHAQP